MSVSPDRPRRVLILEPDLDGHHAFWLALLIDAYRNAGWSVEVLTASDSTRLDDQARLRGSDFSGVRRHVCVAGKDLQLLRQALEIAARTGAERLFVAFVDRFWGAILNLVSSWPAGAGWPRLAGIWFHPHALDAKWRWAPPLGKRWRLRGRLNRFLRSADAARIWDSLCFLVDEPAVLMQRINPAIRCHLLPDPYEREPRLEWLEARRALGVPEKRTVFLHLGSAERRKGLPDVLEVFEKLTAAQVSAQGRPALLLRVGANDRLRPGERACLDRLVGSGRAMVIERFVPADELMEYFAASDWVLVPYRKFRYSSGIVANSLGACRPMIVSDYGQVGREVARDGTGVLYTHGSSASLLSAVAAVMADPGLAGRFAEGLKTARAARNVATMQSALARYLTPDGVERSP